MTFTTREGHKPLYVLFASAAKHGHSTATRYARMAADADWADDAEIYRTRAERMRVASWEHLQAARTARGARCTR